MARNQLLKNRANLVQRFKLAKLNSFHTKVWFIIRRSFADSKSRFLELFSDTFMSNPD